MNAQLARVAGDKPKRKMPKHWYFQYYRECVLCGASESGRERRYGDKPENPEDRHDYEQYACGEHFC